MLTIRNTTSRPLRVPLPRGKTLHLGPRKDGEIAANAREHPPLAALLEKGEIEIIAEAAHADLGHPSGGGGPVSTHGHAQGSLSAHHRGER